ncbi:MAG: MATE family efflux transporter [Planctomycetes bacterium]|nr:MATE family efflux transporter [Planctomycetota bacterium]
MAVPMLAGTFAMNAYNLTDTWFVSRLGTDALAAMGFTFPVVMLLTFVAGGIGTGVMTLASHAIGRHDQDTASRLTTLGIALIVLVAAAMASVGHMTVEPVFKALNAKPETLPLVGQYMRTWYLGAMFMALPMLGNGILISVGDSKSASGLMMLGTGLNVVLDWIMIFGHFGCPAMGIRGAALATVIAQAVATVWLLALLYRKHRLLVFRTWSARDCLSSIRGIVLYGVPSVLSMILMPISATVITRILGGFGKEPVAACGAAGRIEMFAFVIPMALGMSLTPFVSQNFGAGRSDRIREAQRVASRFAVLYGGLVAVVFFLCAPWLASAFSDDPMVVKTLILYIRTISFGYGLMEVHRYSTFFLTGLHRPFLATLLNGFRVLVLLLPLSYLGAHLLDVRGVFFGRLATDVICGSLGYLWVSRMCKSVAAQQADAH